MKLKHWVRFLLQQDTTWQGQFAALKPLLLGDRDVEPFVVDVGANDGFYNSNSYPFIARGWKALLVEPNPDAFERVRQLHRHRVQVTLINVACSDRGGELNLTIFADDDGGSHSRLGTPQPARGTVDALASSSVVPVKVFRLETLLDGECAPRNFGLLSIDTEGHDYQVLLGANLSRYKPQVIITENTPEDEAKFALLRRHGYALYAALPYDSVWSRTGDLGGGLGHVGGFDLEGTPGRV